MTNSDIHIDEKHGRICIYIEGHGWWRLPKDQEAFRALFRKYIEVQKELRGEDSVEDFILED